MSAGVPLRFPLTRLQLELEGCDDCGDTGSDCRFLARCHPMAGLLATFMPASGELVLTCASCGQPAASVLVAPYMPISSFSQVRTREQRRAIAQPVLDLMRANGSPSQLVVEATFARLGSGMGLGDFSQQQPALEELLKAFAARDVDAVREIIEQWIAAAPEDGHVH